MTTDTLTLIKLTVNETLIQLGVAKDTISQADAKRIYKSKLKEFESNGLVKPILHGTRKRYKIAELILANNTNYSLNKFLVK